MIDKLINLIRQNTGGGVLDNNTLTAEKNEKAIHTAGTSIMSTLQNALSGGRISDVLDYFKGGGSQSHSIVEEATSNYARDLQKEVGLNETDAQAAANKVIPQTMTQLAAKTADPADNNFNIQDIFNKLSGGKTGGLDLQGMLNRFKGKLDKDNDGDVDLQDLKAMFSGEGGLVDKVKGIFS